MDRQEGTKPSLANSFPGFAFCDFIKCYSSLFFFSLVATQLLTLSAVWIINFGLCEQIETKLWSVYHW